MITKGKKNPNVINYLNYHEIFNKFFNHGKRHEEIGNVGIVILQEIINSLQLHQQQIDIGFTIKIDFKRYIMEVECCKFTTVKLLTNGHPDRRCKSVLLVVSVSSINRSVRLWNPLNCGWRLRRQPTRRKSVNWANENMDEGNLYALVPWPFKSSTNFLTVFCFDNEDKIWSISTQVTSASISIPNSTIGPVCFNKTWKIAENNLHLLLISRLWLGISLKDCSSCENAPVSLDDWWVHSSNTSVGIVFQWCSHSLESTLVLPASWIGRKHKTRCIALRGSLSMAAFSDPWQTAQQQATATKIQLQLRIWEVATVDSSKQLSKTYIFQEFNYRTTDRYK